MDAGQPLRGRQQRRRGRRVPAFVLRAAVLATIWWVLTGGDPRAWGWGIPAVVIAALVDPGLPTSGSWRWRPLGVVRFLPAFLWYSFRGALDVALLALRSQSRVDPALIEYPLRLPSGPARIFFANLINLVPGTLSARIGHDHIQVHVIRRAIDVETTLRYLEKRVADLFALDHHLEAGHD